MRQIRWGLGVGVVVGGLLVATSASAATILQCPGVQLNPGGCQFLITVNPDGTFTTTASTTDTGPYDGVEDTLVGIQNNSATAFLSLALTSTTDIFGFDGDGACAAINCGNNDPAAFGYGGRVSTTSLPNPTGPNVTYTNITNAFRNGTVVFGPNGIAPGGSAWFSLEEAFTINTFPIPGGVPEPSSLLLLGSGLAFAYRRVRR